MYGGLVHACPVALWCLLSHWLAVELRSCASGRHKKSLISISLIITRMAVGSSAWSSHCRCSCFQRCRGASHWHWQCHMVPLVLRQCHRGVGHSVRQLSRLLLSQHSVSAGRHGSCRCCALHCPSTSRLHHDASINLCASPKNMAVRLCLSSPAHPAKNIAPQTWVMGMSVSMLTPSKPGSPSCSPFP